MMAGQNRGIDLVVSAIKPGGVGVELGVWKGDSSEKLLRTFPKQLHLVDTWSIEPYLKTEELKERLISRYSSMIGSSKLKDFESYYEKVYNYVKGRFKVHNNVNIHKKSTEEFFNSNKIMFDWIYVDAHHDYENVLFDLNQSLTYLKKDGIIFGDDYNRKPGVNQAVDEFVSINNLSFSYLGETQFKVIR